MTTRRATRKGAAALLLTTVLVLTLQSTPTAHDIPSGVVMNAFVKPEGNRLHLVVRIPLVLLADMNFPQRGPGYLALASLDPVLEATIGESAAWINLYENGRLLATVGGEARISVPSNRSFSTYEEAIAHISGPRLPVETNMFWNQGFFRCSLGVPG